MDLLVFALRRFIEQAEQVIGLDAGELEEFPAAFLAYCDPFGEID